MLDKVKSKIELRHIMLILISRKYAANHNLFISWAEVTCKDLRNEIEEFLADFLEPLVGYQYPNGYPQAVNLPENFPDPSNSPWYQLSRGQADSQ